MGMGNKLSMWKEFEIVALLLLHTRRKEVARRCKVSTSTVATVKRRWPLFFYKTTRRVRKKLPENLEGSSRE